MKKNKSKIPNLNFSKIDRLIQKNPWVKEIFIFSEKFA